MQTLGLQRDPLAEVPLSATRIKKLDAFHLEGDLHILQICFSRVQLHSWHVLRNGQVRMVGELRLVAQGVAEQLLMQGPASEACNGAAKHPGRCLRSSSIARHGYQRVVPDRR